VNAINGTKANLGGAYLNTIIQDFNKTIRVELLQHSTLQKPEIETTTSNWFNILMNYHVFMVPGILAVLVTMVGGFLAALNIVKEKEIGTIEQINVTPIKKHHFILGKLIPFWILGNIVFTLGLMVSWLIYGIVSVGNLFVLYAFISVYLLAILGFGLLISTYCETQQQAMFIMFFFAQKISVFIHKHPTLKMLALSFLLMIGFSLFFEGLEPLHHAHIDKGYIYFAMAFSFVVELLNLWIRKKEKKRRPVELKEPMLEEKKG